VGKAFLPHPQDLSDPDSKFINVLCIDIHYKEFGSGENTFLLVHGFGAGVFSFNSVSKELAKYERVVALDLPGFGLSERPKNFTLNGIDSYSRIGQVEVLRTFVGELKLSNIILVGHSMGGGVAALFTEKYPNLVRALILEDPSISSNGLPKGISAFLKSPVGKFLFPLLLKPITSSLEGVIDKAYFDKLKITPQMKENYLKTLKVKDWDKGLYYLSIADNTFDGEEGLSKISIPTLVITGANDEIVSPTLSKKVSGLIPKSQFAVIENCGHIPHEEKPLEFVEKVLNFLRVLNIGVV
jgi:pimeloyl-ACP methyl ester carboxylesterase